MGIAATRLLALTLVLGTVACSGSGGEADPGAERAGDEATPTTDAPTTAPTTTITVATTTVPTTAMVDPAAPGQLVPPAGLDQARADAFAAAVATAYRAPGSHVSVLHDVLQRSLDYGWRWCGVADEYAPSGTDYVEGSVLQEAYIDFTQLSVTRQYERVEVIQAGEYAPDDTGQAPKEIVRHSLRAAGDHLCPQYGPAFHRVAEYDGWA